MKKSFALSALVALAVGFVVSAETNPLIVPKTDAGSLQALPLSEGQMGYADNDDGSASLYVGGTGANDTRIVADPFTLRGYKEEEIKFGEYVVSHTSGITYNAADNSWTVNHNNTGVTERVIFKVADGREISSFEYDTFNLIENGTLQCTCGRIEGFIGENTLTFELEKKHKGDLKLFDVAMSYIPVGGSTDVIDLTKLHIMVHDSTCGTNRIEGLYDSYSYDLGTLREKVQAYARSMDHADKWYKYNGSNDVTITYKDFSEQDKMLYSKNMWALIQKKRKENYGNGFWFDGPGMQKHMYKLYMDTATTNMCVKAGSQIPLEVSFRGSDTNHFDITKMEHDSKTHTTKLFLSATVEAFSVANLKVYWADNLTNIVWTQFAPSAFVFSEGNIIIPNRTNPLEFYKIDYQASSITPPRSIIYMRGEVIMEDGLKVKDFDSVWRVSDGKALSVYIDEKIAGGGGGGGVQPKDKMADLVSLSGTTVVATNGVIYNASIGAGPLNITVPAYTTGKSDSFTIRITATAATQIGTVQGPTGEAVTLEWLSDPLTVTGAIGSTKPVYLMMTRVGEWAFLCTAKEIQ